MSSCPQCNKTLRAPSVAFFNAEQYHNTNIAVTDCCRKPIHIRAVVSFDITKYEGEATEDDWGNKIK